MKTAIKIVATGFATLVVLAHAVIGSAAEIKVLSARQETLKADKQKATQDLRAAFDRARDQAIQVRAAVKSRLGPRTEKLVEFQMAPIRPRTRTTKKSPAPTPAAPSRPPALAGDPSAETA